MSDVVSLVHRQLEFLKYVGAMREETTGHRVPTGQGWAVGVAVLPDLLLDFRDYNRRKHQKRICAVGGRAARMACVLQHLLGDDDGSFQVHLLAKTGNLGRLLLQDEFFIKSRQESRRVPFLENILLHDEEPRCALRSQLGVPAMSSPAFEDRELNAGDLKKALFKQAIRQSRAVCLTSVRTPHFKQLLHDVMSAVQLPYQRLFIDSRRAAARDNPGKIGILKNELRGMSQALKVAGIFLKTEDRGDFLHQLGCGTEQEVVTEYGVPLICYGDGKEVSWIASSGRTISVPCPAHFQIEGISECFKAGVLLAWSVQSAVQELHDAQPSVCESVKNGSARGADAHWKTVLGYGAALAEARTDPDKPSTLPDLLARAVNATEHLPHAEAFEPSHLVKVSPTSGRNRRLDLESPTLLACVARLAGWRRISVRGDGTIASPNALLCRDLAICRKESKKCLHCVHSSGREKVGAVMIDLDGTLMHSTEQRNRGLAKALATLALELSELAKKSPTDADLCKIAEAVRGVAQPPGTLRRGKRRETDGDTAQGKAVEFFTENVYERHSLYAEKGLDLGDFRQEWNHAGWYITYIVLAQNRGFCGDVARWASEDASPAGESLEKAKWKKEFHDAYNHVARKYREMIRKAQGAFERIQMQPFKEARDFLQSLKLTESLDLYIVSEGDPETQWLKLVSTGLSDFFDREHVLTTGDAVEPVDVRKGLQAEQKALEVEGIYIKDKEEQLEEEIRHLQHVETQVTRGVAACQAKRINDIFFHARHQTEQELDQLEEQSRTNEKRKKVTEFVGLVIDHMGGKNFLSFYAGAVRAILRNPLTPRSRLASFGELLQPISAKVKLKFVMIGDRQSNDIEPPSALLNDEILTIRINSLHYAEKEPVEPASARSPVFVVDTLAQAKAILLTKDIWNEVKCVSDPPIFNWEVNATYRDHYPDSRKDSSIGLDYVLCGCQMPHRLFPTTNEICAGILVEHLASCDVNQREEILRPYLSSSDIPNLESPDTSAPSALDRVSLLCSIVHTKALYRPPLSEVQFRVTKQIGADATLLKDDDSVSHKLRTALESIWAEGQEDSKKEAEAVLVQLGWM